MYQVSKSFTFSLALVLAVSYIYPSSAMAGTLEFDGVPVDITTAEGEDLLIVPGTGGNVQVGDASGTNSNATSNDDIHITGILEVDSASYLDGGAVLGGNLIPSLNLTHDIGSSTKYWNNLYTSNIFAGDIAKIKEVAYSWPAAQGAASTYLKNDGAGNLTWAAVAGGGGSSLPAVDTTSVVEGSADATKEIRFEVDGLTTGTIRTLTVQDVSGTVYVSGGTDIPVLDGGTGASDALNARANLGLAIGTDVQGYDPSLDDWSTKTAPAGVVVGTSDTQTLTNKSISGGQITSAVANATLAASATALAANGANCTAGNYPLGVDASGAVETCTAIPTGGDASTNTATSVADELPLFADTTGKLLKRASGSGVATLTSGVLGTVSAPTGAIVGTTDTQTLTNKSISGGQITSAVANATLAASATALAANGANCSAGQYPLGVDASGAVESCTAAGVGDMVLASTQTVTGTKTFGSAGDVGKLAVAGTTSGSTVLDASAVASGILTLPAATDTLVGRATTDTLTNKSISGGQITSAVANATLAATATALAANGANCTAGNYPLGVDASGAVETCTAIPTGGDASTNTATSVADELPLFADTTGKLLKRASGSGVATLTSGVLGTVSAPTGSIVGTSDSQTLTNKSLADSTTFIVDNTDVTKRLNLDVTANTTNITGTLSTAFTTAKTIAFPDAAGTVAVSATAPATLSAAGDIGVNAASGVQSGVVTTGAQTFAGIKTFTNGIDSGTVSTTSGNVTLQPAGSGTVGRVVVGAANGGAGSATPDLLVLDKASGASPAGVEGSILVDSAGKFNIYEGGAWKVLCNSTDQGCGTGSGSAISALTNAAGANSLSAGNNAQAWNWALTTAAKTGMAFSEGTAATNGAGSQFILEAGTASGSTAGPFKISSQSADIGDVVFDLASAGDFLIEDNGTPFASFNDDGTVLFGGATQIDNMLTFGEMSAPATSGTDKGRIYFDSTANKFKVSEHNGAYVDLIGGGGDASTNTSTSVDSEVALFSSTTGKLLKRATASGIAKLTSGVLSTVTAPSGAIVGDTDSQTLTNKSISGGQISSAVANATLAATATALAVNGANCTAGSYPLGVDASGAVESCTAAGTGDASTNTSTSVADEVSLFADTTGKLLKRASGSGVATLTSGVLGTVSAPSGSIVGTSDSQTLTNKSLADSTTFIVDNTDVTKRLNMDVTANTTNITGTVATAFTTAKTLTLPDATDTLVGKNTTDTLTNKSISGGQISSAVANATLAATATALAANGANCTAGSYPLGVDASGAVESCTVAGTGDMLLGTVQTVTALKTFGAPGAVGKFAVAGTTSGSTVLDATAVASGVLTLPAATDTLVGRNTTDTLTNKSISGGQISSAVATATALAANGGNCTAGNYPLGVDASGAVESCTALPASGDASTNTSTSVADEVTLFADTTGKLLKRASGSGVATLTSGVLGTVSAPSGSIVGTSDSQTLTNKSLADSTTFIVDNTDVTKRLNMDVTANTTNITGTVATAFTTAKTLTLPDATDTLVGKNTTDTLTNKSISGGQISSAVANATLAATATALAANGGNCTAGSYPLGVDASGAVESCTAAATGDASTNTATSVDSEVALFSSTTGKLLKRATGTGIAKLTSGVLSTATGGTDYYAPGGTDVAVLDGGTGTSTGSITGTTALTFAAGGTNENVILTPSGTGDTILNGDVAIGPAVAIGKLDVSGADVTALIHDPNGFTGNAYLRLGAGNAANYFGSYLKYDGTTNNLSLGGHSVSDTNVGNDVNYLSLNRSTGNLGLGTDSQLVNVGSAAGDYGATEYGFHVKGANTGLIAIEGTSGKSRLHFADANATSGQRNIVADYDGGKLNFSGLADDLTAGQSDILVLDAVNKRVGIGTATPNTSLEVSGTSNGGYGVIRANVSDNGQFSASPANSTLSLYNQATDAGAYTSIGFSPGSGRSFIVGSQPSATNGQLDFWTDVAGTLTRTVTVGEGAITVSEIAAPATSGTDKGRIYFDSTANKFKVSEHNGAYVDLIGAWGDLTDVTAGAGIAVTNSTGPAPTVALKYTSTLAGDPALTASLAEFATTGIIFEGSTADTNETLLTAADPGADVTLTLPASTDTLVGRDTTDTLTNKTLTTPIIKGEAVVALTAGANIATNAALGNIFTIAHNANATLDAPTNPTTGQKCIWRFKNTDASAHTLTLASGAGAFRFGSTISGLSATPAGKIDYIGAIYNTTDNRWDVIAYAKGYV